MQVGSEKRKDGFGQERFVMKFRFRPKIYLFAWNVTALPKSPPKFVRLVSLYGYDANVTSRYVHGDSMVLQVFYFFTPREYFLPDELSLQLRDAMHFIASPRKSL